MGWAVSLIEEEKRRLCLNHAKPLTSPQPKLLDRSILFSFVKLVFECEQPFIDKLMIIELTSLYQAHGYRAWVRN